MQNTDYTALIRTFNSEQTLPETLASLGRQSLPPREYVFVDSGSVDRTLDILPAGSKVHRYASGKFNYSIALNEGINLVKTKYTLVISSHTSLLNKEALRAAIEFLHRRSDVPAAYFVQKLSELIEFDIITEENFTGFNGVWNTCALYDTHLLKQRPFRPEVFSAEDQEWSKWLLSSGKYIVRVSGAGMSYNNPLRNRFRKRLNEELAVALFVKDEMLRFPYIARVIYRIIRPISNNEERLFQAALLYNLLKLNYSGRKFP
ncbi:glycosyltransferase family 2 protein [Sinorhizobium chiapasense]|uniref:Glycosyltransferase family 2 protein n=1 Tax=Sinorhizobium chiapasense TaxID=501572 RepID=A0ABZ2BHK2_9HYPH